MMSEYKQKRLAHKFHDLIFRAVHNNYLIYNVCWEDPRIDRQILSLNRDSKAVVLTSAGCNTLDYLLEQPAEIHAVDVNPRQNALLHLKLALIEQGNFENLFTMFGEGSHQGFRSVYASVRKQLPDYAQLFWDEKIRYFDSNNKKQSFYYHGTSGAVAWTLKRYLLRSKTLRQHIFDFLDAQTLAEQKEIYQQIEPALWNRFTSWVVKQPLTLAMLGVPRPQIQLINRQHPGGVLGYVGDKLRHVLTEVLIRDNYFWRVYLTGYYTQTCCPNYLKMENFSALRENIAKIHTHNSTVSQFLKNHPGEYSHFVLLDHQDWLAWHDPAALREEWELILRNSRPGSRILLRSAAMDINFLPEPVKPKLQFFPELTERLHQEDRVGTYGSLHLAEVL
ncbi:MAG: BtaA family protein [Candidatus Competibacteraceae bacterium]|jgi:S-adenosylmethionine-diacylglycerol 3-amino-3-carboxypropyl transferase|nr:BtaA family protein [Candidatus Competibacteraceae bacterium]